jgi:Uma2 family endonuclease
VPAEARRIDVATLTPAALPDLYEVVNGEVIGKVFTVRQLAIAARLGMFLHRHTEPRRLGQVVMLPLFHLGDGAPERRPILAFVADARWPFDLEAPEADVWPVVPNLAVEVIGPSDTVCEIARKVREYFRAGVESVWVVVTVTQQAHLYRSPTELRILSHEQTLHGDPVLPGFELPLRDLFSKRSQ